MSEESAKPEDRVRELSEPSAEPDQQTAREEIELGLAREELRLRKLQNRTADWLFVNRRRFLRILFGTAALWLVILIVFLIWSGWKTGGPSDAVLIALMTATSVNVIAWFYTAVKFLFHEQGTDRPPTKEDES